MSSKTHEIRRRVTHARQGGAAAQEPVHLPSQHDLVASILSLQRIVGNRAVAQSLAGQSYRQPYSVNYGTRPLSMWAADSRNAQLDGRALSSAGTTVAISALQRQAVPGGGATPGTGEGIDLIFIIRAPDDPYTASVTNYVKTVLKGQSSYEINNLDDLLTVLEQVASGGASRSADAAEHARQKVRRIRIVAHGSTTGGVKMRPKGKEKLRWFTPDEVRKYTAQPHIKDTVKNVMAPGAQIEFWGCNIGNVAAAGEAWRDLFHSKFSATTGKFKTGFDVFYRRAQGREPGVAFKGRKGRWMQVTKTSQVDSRNQALKDDFRTWLLLRYAEFVANGDIAPIEREDAQVTYMRDLFDRSQGNLKYIMVERKSDKQRVRPQDQENWTDLWETIEVNP